VLLEKDGVSVTATGIRSEGMSDAILDVTVVNGSDKLLRLDADDMYVNTYAVYPQVCCPTEDEDGFTFYADAVIEPGETKDCQMRLNSLDTYFIERICEIELRASVVEVEMGDYGYEYSGDFAEGDTVFLRTSLYDENVSYDQEGTVLLEYNGLQLVLLKAENGEYTGPEITLYAYNGGDSDVELGLTEMKLDGETYEGFFGMTVPAGKRCVTTASPFIMDFDNMPVAREAELTFHTVNQETFEPDVVFDPVIVTFPE